MRLVLYSGSVACMIKVNIAIVFLINCVVILLNLVLINRQSNYIKTNNRKFQWNDDVLKLN